MHNLLNYRYLPVVFISALFVLILNSGCLNDSEEQILTQNTCDTLQVTYAGSVVSIMETRCVSCHSSSITEAGIALDTYDRVKTMAESGLLLNTIKHTAGYAPMPYGQEMISACEIAKIEAWVNQQMQP